MNAFKKRGQAFRGYPLRDFIDPNGFNLDHILRSTILKAQIDKHIRAFPFSKSGANKTSQPPSHGIRSEVGYSGPDLQTSTNPSSQSFEEQFKNFLDGLYLGWFKSSVIQPYPQRPPWSYVWDIGLNTDKPTGFVVSNPFDTLVTFGPRVRHIPCAGNDPCGVTMPGVPDIKVAQVPISNPRASHTESRGIRGNILVTNTGAGASTLATSNDQPKPAIVCDLNIRVIRNIRQEVQEVSLFGDTLKVHLSRGLVQPVTRSGDQWVKTGRRLELGMGSRVITLRRNHLPMWGGPVDVEGTNVFITSTNLVGRLHHVDFGGSPAKPLIVFDGVDILK